MIPEASAVSQPVVVGALLQPVFVEAGKLLVTRQSVPWVFQGCETLL